MPEVSTTLEHDVDSEEDTVEHKSGKLVQKGVASLVTLVPETMSSPTVAEEKTKTDEYNRMYNILKKQFEPPQQPPDDFNYESTGFEEPFPGEMEARYLAEGEEPAEGVQVHVTDRGARWVTHADEAQASGTQEGTDSLDIDDPLHPDYTNERDTDEKYGDYNPFQRSREYKQAEHRQESEYPDGRNHDFSALHEYENDKKYRVLEQDDLTNIKRMAHDILHRDGLSQKMALMDLIHKVDSIRGNKHSSHHMRATGDKKKMQEIERYGTALTREKDEVEDDGVGYNIDEGFYNREPKPKDVEKSADDTNLINMITRNVLRKLEKGIDNPFAVATAQAKKMGYSDFTEGSGGDKKRDEIAEALKRKE